MKFIYSLSLVINLLKRNFFAFRNIRNYKKLATMGDSVAQYNLALAYESGKGVSQDYVKAAMWYQKAADQGNPTSQFYLGFLYEFGEGVSKDIYTAKKWYQKAADQGNNQAKHRIDSLNS